MVVVDPPSSVAWLLRFAAWVSVPTCFVVGLAMALVLRVALLRAVPPQPWTERARATFPARTVFSIASLVALVGFGICGGLFPSNIPHAPSATVLGVCCALAGYAAIDLVRLDLERRIHRRAIPASGWLRWKPIVFALYGSVVIPPVVGAMLVHDRFDAHTFVVFGVVVFFAALIGTGAIWLIFWWIGVIRPAPMRLRAAVDRASTRTGVTPRALGVLSTFGVPFANAFALPILRRIAFTSESLAILTDDEIEAVAAHELGHVGEPRSVAFVRVLRAMILTPLVLLRPVFAVANAWGVVALFVAFVVLARLSARLARKMEERADEIAHGGGGDGPIYARALEKLYERNLVPAVLGGRRRTHPDLWDRMVSAGVTPSYAKPQPPRNRPAFVLAFVVAYAACVFIGVFDAWAQTRTDEQLAAFWCGEARALLDRGDSVDALILYEAALGLDRRPSIRAAVAWAEALNDVCDDATQELRSARSSKRRDPALAEILPHADAAVTDCLRRRGPVDPEFEQDADD